MENQLDTDYDKTDLDTFLNEMINQFKKEGISLQSFAKTWFAKGDLEHDTIKHYGIYICVLADQLLLIRQQLCNACKMKSVVLTLNFNSDTDNKEEKEGKRDKK